MNAFDKNLTRKKRHDELNIDFNCVKPYLIDIFGVNMAKTALQMDQKSGEIKTRSKFSTR
jgi:hypothetical protein